MLLRLYEENASIYKMFAEECKIGSNDHFSFSYFLKYAFIKDFVPELSDNFCVIQHGSLLYCLGEI